MMGEARGIQLTLIGETYLYKCFPTQIVCFQKQAHCKDLSV